MLDEAGFYVELAEAAPYQRATVLVVETGDLLLELRIVTATESLPTRAPPRRRKLQWRRRFRPSPGMCPLAQIAPQ